MRLGGLPAVLLGAVLAGAPGVLTLGRIEHPDVKESSGLAHSQRRADAWWTLNDSGNEPVIYALQLSGKALGQARLRGATDRDWEALSLDEQGTLWAGDVGDNGRSHQELVLYRLPEPDPAAVAELDCRAVRLVWPAAPHYVESLVVRDGVAWIITKEGGGEPGPAEVYRADALDPDTPQRLRRVGTLACGEPITDAGLSDDGKRLAVTGYRCVFVFAAEGGMAELLQARPHRFEFGLLGQVEAVAFDGSDLVLTTEQRGLYRIPHDLYERAPQVDASAAAGQEH